MGPFNLIAKEVCVQLTQVIPMHCRRLGTAAQTLLGGYVEAHGRQLTIAVRRSVDSTNWLQVSFSQH